MPKGYPPEFRRRVLALLEARTATSAGPPSQGPYLPRSVAPCDPPGRRLPHGAGPGRMVFRPIQTASANPGVGPDQQRKALICDPL